ncbi:hypothetical protein GCM10009841_24960 [Microlunatus panaciterrae]|uniref:CAAX protease self-immunity n=1 Tax=Microlunatus panaciterrae TaxID=400768 RepID=A0ABS2RF67_9ACTN|nr:hypothetical protein [Microlunatus panaciterrae]MBM7797378.1 hypothetical protein [Microlunatus panaciterrae]
MLASAGYLVALGLTCLVEVPLFLVGCRSMGWLGGTRGGTVLLWWQAALLGLGANLLTHPLLWSVSLRLDSVGQLLGAEAGVVVVEALITWTVVRRQLGWSLLLSLGTNSASLLVGSLLMPLVLR